MKFHNYEWVCNSIGFSFVNNYNYLENFIKNDFIFFLAEKMIFSLFYFVNKYVFDNSDSY